MKHTPGPWFPSFHANICIGVQNSPDGFTQMICNSILPDKDEEYENQREEIEANAKLIAAAPELLEACVESLSTIEMLLDEIGKIHPSASISITSIQKAIKKATK